MTVTLTSLPSVLATRVHEDANGCWLWSGAKTTAGYGHLRHDGGYEYTHRLAYLAIVGPIPDGWTIDHLCRIHACCNPAHLETVTRAENIRRAARAITQCRHGHAYNDENTYVDPDGGRRCRACAREADRRRHAAKQRSAA